jgi:hypothetical protein
VGSITCASHNFDTWRLSSASNNGGNLYGLILTGLSSSKGIFTGGRFDNGMSASSVINRLYSRIPVTKKQVRRIPALSISLFAESTCRPTSLMASILSSCEVTVLRLNLSVRLLLIGRMHCGFDRPLMLRY